MCFANSSFSLPSPAALSLVTVAPSAIPEEIQSDDGVMQSPKIVDIAFQKGDFILYVTACVNS